MMSPGEPRASLILTLTSPGGSVWVGPNGRFSVSGTAKGFFGNGGHKISHEHIDVQVQAEDGQGNQAHVHAVNDRWTTSVLASGLQDRQITVRVTARLDRRSGFVADPVSASRTVTVRRDTTAPDLTVDSPRGSIKVSGSDIAITVAGTVKDNQSGVSRVDVGVGEPNERAEVRGQDWTARLTLPGIDRYDIVARAKDRVGNSRFREQRVTTVDTGPPQLNIDRPPDGQTFDWPDDEQFTVVVRGTAFDEGTGVKAVRWRLGNDYGAAIDISQEAEDQWAQWEARVPLSGPGQHTVEISAEDGAENTTTREVTVRVTDDSPVVDNVEPVSPHDVYSRDGIAEVEVRGSLAESVASVARVEWSLDDTTYEPTNKREDDWKHWSFDTQLEGFGTHKIFIRSVHPSGTPSSPHELIVRHLEVFS